MACVSEDLKCLGAGDTTCGRKAKDIDRLEERGAERGSARRFSLKGRERGVIVSQDEHWNYFKGNIRETSEKGWERIVVYHLEL